MNTIRTWSLVTVAGVVCGSTTLTQGGTGPSVSAPRQERDAPAGEKTALFGLCWPSGGCGRGYSYGYGSCGPCGGYGSYGGGYCPRPVCAPCGPVGGCYGGGFGAGYSGGYGYGGYGGYYGAPVAPAYPAPVYGAPAYGMPYYQGMGYNAEEGSPSAPSSTYTSRRRNARPALAEEDSPFFK